MRIDDGQLQQGMASFVTAARELEHSYRALKQRADAVALELQASNQALQQALQEREAIVAALPLGLFTVDRHGVLRCCNGEAERLQALAANAGCDLLQQPDGEIEAGDLRLRLQRLQLPTGALLLVEDRSRVADLERKVQRLDRLAGLSELALGIAHEIKNPLNGIMGFAALLERSSQEPQARRHASRIVQGVQQVDLIVKSLLGFARPERSRGRTAPLRQLLASAARAAGLPTTRLLISGALETLADADAVECVLTNLFRNAAEAAADVTVRAHAEVAGDALLLQVCDDGPGIPAGLGERVFEPFVSTKERGTGLGLPLALRVLAFLGGDLRLANPGQPGARFELRLPLLAQAAAPAHEPPPGPASPIATHLQHAAAS
jgi:two-component system, NtrC family, sensor histidine kinase HydH